MKSLLLACVFLCALPPGARAQVVVLVHPETAKFVVVQNRPAPLAEATKRALMTEPGGWDVILQSTVPGHGAMFCFRPKGAAARFFPVEGKATGAEAIKQARSLANAAAQGTGVTTGGCGLWNNRNAYPLDVAASGRAAPRPGSSASGGSGEPRQEAGRGLLEAAKD